MALQAGRADELRLAATSCRVRRSGLRLAHDDHEDGDVRLRAQVSQEYLHDAPEVQPRELLLKNVAIVSISH